MFNNVYCMALLNFFALAALFPLLFIGVFLSGSASVNCLSVWVIRCFLFYFEVPFVSYSPCPVKCWPSGLFDYSPFLMCPPVFNCLPCLFNPWAPFLLRQIVWSTYRAFLGLFLVSLLVSNLYSVFWLQSLPYPYLYLCLIWISGCDFY